MLTGIKENSTIQAKPTQKTLEAATMLLDYAANYPDTTLWHDASDMILYGEWDKASYLVMPNARSCVAGFLLIK